MNLKEEIDKFLEEKEEKRKLTNRDYFYVSELGKTKRELYESIKLKKKYKIEPQLARIFDNGNSLHERYIKMFAEMRILVAAEIDAVKEDFIHGRLDCIISDKQKNYIVELKSCNMWTFNKLSKPILKDYLQIQFYMYYTNISKGIVLYENKNDQSIKCFDIELDEKLIEKTIEELKQLKKDIEEGKIPEEETLINKELYYGN